MSLWIAAGGLFLGVLIAFILPLLRHRHLASEDHDLLVYEDQLAEVDRDLERGLLTESQAEGVRREIRKRLERLAIDATGSPVQATFGKIEIAALVIVLLLLPAGAFGLYGVLGSPDRPDLPMSARNVSRPTPAPAAQAGQLDNLADGLAKRMEQSPERLDGWMLLGRTYMNLERYPDAAKAFSRAYGLDQRQPDVAASYAEALYLSDGSRFSERTRGIMRIALQVNPRDFKALFYAGMDLVQQTRYADAIQVWVNLTAISPPNAAWRSVVQSQMRAAAKAGGIDIASIRPTLQPNRPVTPPVAATPAAPGPTREDVEAAGRMSAEDRMDFIRSMVARLAERLEGQPNDLAGWRRLARAYRVLGETEKAKAAETRIAELEKREDAK